jgi:salicylate hydroxylase
MLEWREDTSIAWSPWEHNTTPNYAKGTVCIVGDAAHATPPWQGAGAGQALEDAIILSALFREAKKKEDVENVLKAFHAVRRSRA